MMTEQDRDGMSGSELQESQSGGGSGGYGDAQNQANYQGQQGGQGQAAYGNSGRGAAFDEAQGGGRGVDDISVSEDERYGGSSGEHDEEDGNPAAAEFLRDQQAHQDRGQSEAEEEAG